MCIYISKHVLKTQLLCVHVQKNKLYKVVSLWEITVWAVIQSNTIKNVRQTFWEEASHGLS